MMSTQFDAAAIIVAAGKGQRMGGKDKIFASLGGRALLTWPLYACQRCRQIKRIVLVVNQANLNKARDLVVAEGFSKVTAIVPGGAQRQQSVAAGLEQVGDSRWVVIHDGARPLLTEALIEQGLEAAAATGAAVAAIPVTDTIKLADDDNSVMGTPPRDRLWAVQTPQVFRFDIIDRAHRQAQGLATDDAALVEQAGGKVRLYMGSHKNIKVTTPGDLALAEILLQGGK
jgi:2-C-methyl-D-erythritol 4-phosphate cytidylyltransferase